MLCAIIISSCDIRESVNDESEETLGSVFVTAINLDGDPIEGAAISIDGVNQNAATPDTIHDLSVGPHEISVFKLGFLYASDSVTIEQNEITAAEIELTPDFGSEVGNMAIDFSLPSLEDSSLYTLSDYRGRIVLLSFFFYNCAPCLIEFPEIQNIYEDPRFEGEIEFLGIDGVDPWAVFIRYLMDHPTLGLTFPLLHDQSQAVRGTDYNVTAHPANFLIDQTGVIRFRWGSVTGDLLSNAIQTLLAEGE